MNNKFITTLLFFFLSISCFSFSKFETEKRFYNQEFETIYIDIVKKVDHIILSDEVLDEINAAILVTKNNDYYQNKLSQTLLRYYFLKNDLKSYLALYRNLINKTEIESHLSYIEVLNYLHSFFNQFALYEESEKIMSKIQAYNKKLPYNEKIYIESIISLNNNIRIKGNSIDVQRNKILESINYLEKIQEVFSPTKYNLLLADRYNLLAITYIEENNNSINLDHCISTFKKAIRYNNHINYYMSALIYSNLAYVYNLKKEYNTAIYYGLKAMDLTKNMPSETTLNRRIHCNLADSYNLLNKTNEFKKSYQLCDSYLKNYEKSRAGILILLPKEKNKSIEETPTSSNNKLIYIISGVIILLLSFIIIKRIKIQNFKKE
ncbi:tetratricopeptide repeat protein [Faecalibacter rhinopitheci]|uniref:Tetratricopeptide repeat protein n=1 Tax=Faecalibacter rhinopitheci TaxID=2779678 RepID=A0A8J7G550_9FLAO|nr:hypothetical protein [Faecalibacter rhinopitheci]MBF0596435.1 hypothetical protein [Faecalibacter rhinopitheci]